MSAVIDRTVAGHNQIEIVKSPYSTNMQFLELEALPSLIRLFQNQQNLDITKNQPNLVILLTLGMSLVQLLRSSLKMEELTLTLFLESLQSQV